MHEKELIEISAFPHLQPFSDLHSWQGVLVQRLCEGVLHRAHDSSSAKEGFDKVAGPVWMRFRGLLHAVGGLDG